MLCQCIIVSGSALLCSNASDGEVLTLGGSDPAHYTGNFSCAPINTTNGLWLVKMEGVRIGNETNSPFCHNGCEASVDSGCSYVMIGPPGEVELLHKKLGGTYAPNITNLVSGKEHHHCHCHIHNYNNVV